MREEKQKRKEEDIQKKMCIINALPRAEIDN